MPFGHRYPLYPPASLAARSMARRARTVAATAQVAGRAKKPYASPQLGCYGALSKLTQSGTQAATEMGTGMMRPSSRRVKEELVRVGEHPAGFGIYLFRYKPGWRAR